MEVAVLAAYIFPAINVVMKRQPVKDFDLKAGWKRLLLPSLYASNKACQLLNFFCKK